MSDRKAAAFNVEVCTVIDRPIDEVFAFLSDMENNLMWRPAQIEAKKTSEGPIGVGTTYRVVNKVLGRRIELQGRVTEFEANRKYTNIVESGPLPLEAQRIFESVEGGTPVTLVLRAEPRGWFKLVGPLLASLAKRRIESDIAKAKDLMEADAFGAN